MDVPIIPEQTQTKHAVSITDTLQPHVLLDSTAKHSPDLFLLTRQAIFLIIAELELLAVIHFLMET